MLLRTKRREGEEGKRHTMEVELYLSMHKSTNKSVDACVLRSHAYECAALRYEF